MRRPTARRWSAITIVLFFIQDVAHFEAQVLYGKWFLEEIHTLFQNTPVGDYIRCVAGHEKGFDIRIEGLQLMRQITAVISA